MPIQKGQQIRRGTEALGAGGDRTLTADGLWILTVPANDAAQVTFTVT